jgi:DNA-binding GntR family transcriptional regulator
MATFELGPTAVRRDRGVALHTQIAEAMRLRISTGVWSSGHRLQPEPVLAQEIGVSRGTLRRGIASLIADGLLLQVRGRGTFVASPLDVPAATQRLSTLAEDIVDQGAELRTRVVSAAVVRPAAAVARALQTGSRERVLRLVRVRSTADGPLALLHNYVVADLVPGITEVDFTTATLFGTLEQHYGLDIDHARRRFSATAADGETAAALGMERGTPVQYLEQLTFLGDGRPVEYSDVWIDSARLRVVAHLSRHERRVA